MHSTWRLAPLLLLLLTVACAGEEGSNPNKNGGNGPAGGTTSGEEPAPTGAQAWANWDCQTSGDTYCYAQYEQKYWIECYPNSSYDCYFGSSTLGAGDSCPPNAAQGCGSCEKAFHDCASGWISAGN